jgi:hypothetical protein
MNVQASGTSELLSLTSTRLTAGGMCGEEEERGAGGADGDIAILSSGKFSSSWKAETKAIHVDASDDSSRLVSTISIPLLSPLDRERSSVMRSRMESICTFVLVGGIGLDWDGQRKKTPDVFECRKILKDASHSTDTRPSSVC